MLAHPRELVRKTLAALHRDVLANAPGQGVGVRGEEGLDAAGLAGADARDRTAPSRPQPLGKGWAPEFEGESKRAVVPVQIRHMPEGGQLGMVLRTALYLFLRRKIIKNREK